MANPENGQILGITETKILYKKGVPLKPCSNGCAENPLICDGKTDEGLSYDPNTGKAICLRKREPITVRIHLERTADSMLSLTHGRKAFKSEKPGNLQPLGSQLRGRA